MRVTPPEELDERRWCIACKKGDVLTYGKTVCDRSRSLLLSGVLWASGEKNAVLVRSRAEADSLDPGRFCQVVK